MRQSMQKQSLVRRLLRWVGMILGVVFLFALGYFVAQSGWLDALVGRGTPAEVAATRSMQAGAAAAPEGAAATVPIRSASTAVGVVSAAGNLDLVAEQQVVVEVSGIVSQ